MNWLVRLANWWVGYDLAQLSVHTTYVRIRIDCGVGCVTELETADFQTLNEWLSLVNDDLNLSVCGSFAGQRICKRVLVRRCLSGLEFNNRTDCRLCGRREHAFGTKHKHWNPNNELTVNCIVHFARMCIGWMKCPSCCFLSCLSKSVWMSLCDIVDSGDTHVM